jgi:hypothetical protein
MTDFSKASIPQDENQGIPLGERLLWKFKKILSEDREKQEKQEQQPTETKKDNANQNQKNFQPQVKKVFKQANLNQEKRKKQYSEQP